MNASLEAIALDIGYGRGRNRVPVLNDINLAVEPGRFVALVGANGTGKSTLLRTLSGVLRPHAGEVRLSGKPIGKLSRADIARELAIVSTERIQAGALSVYDMVGLGRHPYTGWSGRLAPADHAVVSWALEASGAASFANDDINRLSDGQRQRAMVARALAQQPGTMLLDEPTAFLDVPGRVELMALLRRLAVQAGLAIVVSTHDIELALRSADTLWVIAPDQRIHVGAPEDLIHDGSIAASFRGRDMTFDPAARTFRLQPPSGHTARVDGDRTLVPLAAAVLEREGFAIADPGTELVVEVAAAGTEVEWRARSAHGTATGDSFSALATHARTVATTPATDLGDEPGEGEAAEAPVPLYTAS